MKAVFTIVTANYLAQAKTVVDSFITHNPDYTFTICLLDKINDRFDKVEFHPHELLEVEALNIPYFVEMYERYDMFELSNALKPFFAEYLCQRSTDLKTLMYVDSDMMVFDTFEYAEEQLKEFTICLTPHILTTIPKDDLQPDESVFLNAGIYNGGFFALAINGESLKFLSWWKEKLRYYCFHNVCKGLFVDQIWLNYVPLFFDKVHILKHPGYNVAYYNLHERYINCSNQKYRVNEKYPLVLYHYTGFDIKQPELLSKYQTRFNFKYRLDVEPLYQKYKDKLVENKHGFFSNLIPYYQELRQEKMRYEEQIKLEEEQKRTKELKEMVNEAVNQQSIIGIMRKIKNRITK